VDYRVALDLDLAQPDSVRFEADVVRTGWCSIPLDQATAARAQRAVRSSRPAAARARGRCAKLSVNNPHFRRSIQSRPSSPCGRHERGRWVFSHHGFNTEAMKQAIAENLRPAPIGAGPARSRCSSRAISIRATRALSPAGAGDRAGLDARAPHRCLEGALARDLPEHYRVGPGVHGATRAARFYFDRDGTTSHSISHYSSRRSSRLRAAGAGVLIPTAQRVPT